MVPGYILFVSVFGNINSPNSRVLDLARMSSRKFRVVSADFDHGKKCYYNSIETDNKSQDLIHVPSYKKNLSIKRIWSHLVFAFRLNSYLHKLSETPSIVYCAMPTSSAAFVCARYCKNEIKFVVDVIDLWPDSLLPFFNFKNIINFLLYPWSYLTRYAYRSADVIIGESVKYANEAKLYNDHASVYPIYLGVNMSFIDEIKRNNQVELCKPQDEIWIAYAGSLGNSYGFETLLEAVKTIDGAFNFKLWFLGDGSKRDYIEEYIKEAGINAEITGFLPYKELLGYLSFCDIGINLFCKGTKVVFSYKFNDYVAMNCFVLNSLEGETAKMVDDYKIGRNFDFSKNTLSIVLNDTLAHWDFYSLWRVNHQRLINEKLEKNKIYSIARDIFNA